MSVFELLFTAIVSAIVLLVLFGGTFFLLFFERFIYARTQHREGPGLGGRTDYYQVWTDFRKVRLKGGDTLSVMPTRFRAALKAWFVLPALFLLVLLSPLLPEKQGSAELPLLLLLPLLAVGIEALFMHATHDSRERYEWRKRLTLRLMGAAVLYLAVLAVGLRVGASDLGSISNFQARFPYHAIFASPGLLLCGLVAFAAIFLFAAEGPIESKEELGLHRSMQYLIFFVNKMWIFCLLCFWVFVFLGGTGTLLAKVAFPIKALAALFLFSLIQVSLPRARLSDATELTARWLLRLCLLGFSLEAVWVGVRG
jgi:NADH:ubiquinone oxidoreductase subunit H